jgi:hypothetical protein
MADLTQTGHELEHAASTAYSCAIELLAAAKDLGGDAESLRLRSLGIAAEARRLALAALSAAESGAMIACCARAEESHG